MTERRAPPGRGFLLAAACWLTVCWLTACTAPPVKLPPWPAPLKAQDAALLVPPHDDRPRFEAWPAPRWWQDWSLPELTELIDRALARAPSLAAAQARVHLAQATLARTMAGQGLQVGMNAEASFTRWSEAGLVPAAVAGRHEWNNTARVSAQWDLDWSGRQRAAVESTFAALLAVQADAQAAQILLSTEVALVWLERARVHALIAWQQRRHALQGRIIDLVRQRVQAGLDRPDALEILLGIQAGIRAEQDELERQLSRLDLVMQELCGDAPTTQALGSSSWPRLQAPVPPTDLPASLLGRRADLVARRWRVESAQGAVREAHAAHYPDVNLAAFGGLLSLGLDRWISLGARTYGVGPVISLPLFDAGARTARQGEREAQRAVLVAEYHEGLLRALREVAQELDGLHALRRQERSLEAVSQAARRSAKAMRLRQQAGLGSVLPVLESEQLVLTQERPLIELQSRQWMARVSLVRALGGGYDDAQSAHPLRQHLMEPR